ncbi:molybdopterin converting factor subunit 1 [Maribacter aestuarii]|uniref:molybdopterin converting factor subunit 1 n=1 Tax=Maribacter aestuarii TaxID=1130723 RepID=UPI00248CEF2D|nr:molybdopterin converting factor subunit 1 [Maribacter aestuarii]
MEVLFFGIAKDIVGASHMAFSSESNTPETVGDLKQHLVKTYPEFSRLTSMAVAVNSEYAKDNVPLKRDDEVAVIPPVSGG